MLYLLTSQTNKMTKYFTILVTMFIFLSVNGQENTIKAESGDGIFSILRKQGLDPVKYYADFVNLNHKNLKNGSELYLGREYLIPEAPDSYKKMALSITEAADVDQSLFNDELATIAPKSDKLKNAVIYLLPSENGGAKSSETQLVNQQIVRSIAQELMVNGAKVYMLDNLKNEAGLPLTNAHTGINGEKAIGTQQQMQHYVEVINKRYLKNTGKYQRILVVNLNETVKDSKYFEVSVFHHSKSLEGERFARSLQNVFNKNSIANDQKDNTEVFTNSNNLYLATNVLPAVTMIDIGDTRNPSIEERISITSKEEILTNIVTSGVLTDYANISLEK